MSGFLSILDTRKKEWQERKRWWIQKYNIQSELGREDTISKSRFWDDNTVSIFDAKLCEDIYTSFIPPSGSVLDPFAGGSVRGIVAEELGFSYTGIELSQQQVDANKLQSSKPTWICGDSEVVLDTIEGEYDLVFTCPPYHDLEIYSDDKDDLSNMPWDEFLTKYKSIIQKSYDKLKDNRFFVIVVSEIRDRMVTGDYKIGKYKGLVPNTIKIAEECGFHYYNDVILINGSEQAARMSNLYFDRNRKIPSTHQNILMFIKGNPDICAIDIDNKPSMCIIQGKPYSSFRHAAISINPHELTAGEVQRRCVSTKSKYKDWQIIGKETSPIIKYEVNEMLFESINQIVNLFENKFTANTIRGFIDSTNPMYSHWKRSFGKNVSYSEMESMWNTNFEIKKFVIQCDDNKFYSIEDAALHYGLTYERIRQKLKSKNFPNFKYID